MLLLAVLGYPELSVERNKKFKPPGRNLDESVSGDTIRGNGNLSENTSSHKLSVQVGLRGSFAR